MNSAQLNPREMTDEETMKWMQELVAKSEKEKRSAGGACSFEALKNPVRRNILNALEKEPLSISEISKRLEVAGPALRFHLNFLASSYFIRVEDTMVDLTPGGVSVVRSQKRT